MFETIEMPQLSKKLFRVEIKYPNMLLMTNSFVNLDIFSENIEKSIIQYHQFWDINDWKISAKKVLKSRIIKQHITMRFQVKFILTTF